MRLALPRASRVAASLARLEAAGVRGMPNLWQVTLGVYRMGWRLVFRSDTVGTCRTQPPRRTLRATLMRPRLLRLPFLVAERAVSPTDFSGLASSRERIIRHLLGAHHDRRQFVYDLEILEGHPGGLEELRDRARRVVTGEDPRAEWLRDLVVFERYHESLLAAVDEALAGGVTLPPEESKDPDVSFRAYLRWCAAQPPDPRTTLRALREGRLSFAPSSREAR
jgi:hypothetical protein